MLDRVSGSRLAKAASGGGCSMNRGLRRHRPRGRSHRLKVDRREPHDGAAGPGARRGAAGVADPGARASRRRRVAAVAAPRVSAERRAPLRAPQRAAARRARVACGLGRAPGRAASRNGWRDGDRYQHSSGRRCEPLHGGRQRRGFIARGEPRLPPSLGEGLARARSSDDGDFNPPAGVPAWGSTPAAVAHPALTAVR